MALRHLATEVHQLIAALDSTDQLEILLLLLRSPSQTFNIPALVSVSNLPDQSIELALRGLHAKRLVAVVPTEHNQRGYQYAPATIALHAAAEGLALAYETHSIAIIKSLCDRQNRSLRTFADAFRLRGEADR